jgi:hypothetical protein
MGESLRWFGAWKRSTWEVGAKREAYAYGRSGRYRILRHTENCFVVFYRPPYDLSDAWGDIGTATTEQEAIALAQAHNDREAPWATT